MTAPRSLATVATALALATASLVTAGPAAADHEPAPWPQHDRIYLMGADTGYTYWSVDPADPELGATSIVHRCGTTEYWRNLQRGTPCFGGGAEDGRTRWSTFFLPGSVFEVPPAWSAASPLRFHIEIEVDALSDYDVSLGLQTGSTLDYSPPATEVAPGVFEGTLSTQSPLDPGTLNLFSVGVATDSARVATELALRGRSWIELPAPVGARGVPELAAEDTHRPAPGTFSSPTRSFEFNDTDWSSWSFAGDLAEARTFDLELARDAVALVAWVEAYDAPFVQRAVRGLETDPRTLTDAVSLELIRDGATVEHGPGTALGQGVASLATTTFEGGPLSLRVDGVDRTGDPLEYRAFVVAVHGDRTLRAMRWRVPGEQSMRLIAGVCPGAYQPIPVSPEVRTFLVDLDWDTEAVGAPPEWTLRFEFPDAAFPCGELAGGDRVRFTMPGERVSFVGATPPWTGAMVSAYDTTFDYEVRYTYTAPPREHLA